MGLNKFKQGFANHESSPKTDYLAYGAVASSLRSKSIQRDMNLRLRGFLC